MKIKLLLLTIATLVATSTFAQAVGGITGRVVSRSGRHVIDGAKVAIKGTQVKETQTDNNGVFTFKHLPDGTYTITVSAEDFIGMSTTVKVDGAMKDIGLIALSSQGFVSGTDASEFALFDTESGNDAMATPVTLSASKDVYDNIASYKFGAMRFRNRGYETSTQNVYLNGIMMNDALTGYSPWSLWSGLNDATRNQESNSVGVSDYGVGSIGGVTNINARASQMRKGFRSSLVNASGQYRFRLMASYASGVSDNGWSYAFSASTRQGGNDWVNGVSYNAFSYFGSVEKQLDLCNVISLTVLGAPTIRGVQAASTQEVYDLVGSNYYNPNWGYQSGRSRGDMRNARERNTHEPIIMLNHSFEPNDMFKLNTAVSYRFGKNGYSALDWYDAQDPRPDYYRNLPSYFPDDPLKASWVEEGWRNDWNIRQINWDGLYNVNYGSHFTPEEADIVGNGITSNTRRSKYVIEERRTDQQDLNGKVMATFAFRNNSVLNTGIEYRWNKTSYFKKLKDLMGGQYWLDVDQFAERDFGGNQEVIQNNLLTPNRVVKEGDKYGYNYIAHLQNAKLWATYKINFKFFEAYVAGEGSYTNFYREGLYKKGLFANNSFGNSEKQDFLTYTAKAGILAKINANNVISLNFVNMTRAPYFQDAFISPRTRNTIVPNLETEKTTSIDLNYTLRVKGFRMRVSGYYSTIKDQNKLISFYDDLQRSYTNFAMNGIDESHAGMELGFEVPIISGLSAKGAFSYGLYKYTSNPYVTQTVDNSDKIVLQDERVYWKGYKVGGTPQTAANLGLNYRTGKNLFIGVDASYFDAMFIDMNPLYRTDFAHIGLNNEQSQAMAHQEMFPSAFMLNANIGKSWYLVNRKYNLGFSLEVKNILNNQDIKTGGYEQMRLKKVENSAGDIDHYNPFPAKYFYMFGTTYYLNIYFRF